MELPTTMARKLVLKSDSTWIDKVIIGAIPKELRGNTSFTICLISEWLNEPTYYANTAFKGWTVGVEVQIFYKKNSSVDTLNDEIKLAKFFIKNGWTVEQSKNHIQDPDTRQVTKVFYFAKNLILKEEK